MIFFRDQTIDPADQVAFTERFGPTESHPLGSRRGLDDHPEVMVLENRPGKLGPRNDFWHSDISFAEKPPALSMLYSIEATEGGRTRCSATCTRPTRNCPSAFAPSSTALTQYTTPISWSTRCRPVSRRGGPAGCCSSGRPHPPGSDRRALFVNPYYTSHFVGMTREESQPLLEYLYARATRHENIYRHKWRVGDVLMWDNRCAMHYAVRDYDDCLTRYLHRTTAAGDRPV